MIVVLLIIMVGAVLLTCIAVVVYFKVFWFQASVCNPVNLFHYLTAIFTLFLAVLACYAWLESRRSTAALEGQLNALQVEQRPLLWVVNASQPEYAGDSQQVTWNWWYQNIGKTIAKAYARASG